VSPKLTDSAAMADEWLPIKPGTDAVFALGVASILITEKLYDEDFLLNYTNAPQLIRIDTGEAVKDSHGNYLAWDAKTGMALPLPDAGKREGLTLGLAEVYSVDHFKCRTAFDLFSELASRYPAEKVVHLCKIPFPPEKIKEIARNLGYHRPAAIFSPGFTTGRYPNWFQVLRCYSVVNLLLGNIERPGGWYFAKHKFNTGTGWPEPPEVPEYPRPDLNVVPGPWGNVMSSECLDKAPCYTSPKQFHPSTQALPWEHFQAMKEGRLKALFSTAENSAITQLDTRLVYDCLDKLELIIVGEQEPKEFVELADYVIPEASYVERAHLYAFTPLGQDGNEHAIALMRTAAIPPVGDSKPVSWFLTEVAKKLGLSPYFEKLDHQYGWWDKMLRQAGLAVTARDLEEKGPYEETHPMTYNVLFKPITTRSKRFEIYSNELAEECYHHEKSPWHKSHYVYPIPIHIPIAEPRGRDEFYLVSGKASWHQKNATQNNRYLMEDDIEGGFPYTPVYINSARALELGLKEGDSVEVECIGPSKKDDPCVWDDSVIGYRQNVKVHITETVHPDTAFVHFAAGHRSKLMLRKSTEGILHSAFVPLSIEPYAGGCGKNYSLVKIRKVS
jgi:anaerobic selenocysteine-containing dehydrogenase